MTKDEALRMALNGITKVPTFTHGLMVKLADVEAAIKPNSMGDKLLFKSTAIMLSGMPITAPQKPEQEPVAIVIEELEHDGQGFCAKVRWLYNPVPVNETLSWEHPK